MLSLGIIITLIFSSASRCLYLKAPIIDTPIGWTDDVILSNLGEQDKYCAIEVNGDDVHVVWQHTDYTDLEYFIYYMKSEDRGRTWSSVSILDNNPDYNIGYPDIAVSGQNVHVVWDNSTGWNGIYYRNSTDGGESWNPIKRISAEGVNTLTPKVYVDNSNVHITWQDQRDGLDREIYYRRSLDGGMTFDNGQGVNEDRRLTYSPATLASLRMGGQGSNISILWTDNSDGDSDKYWMISKDNGNIWDDGLGTPNVGRKLSIDITDSDSGGVVIEGSDIHVVWKDQEWPGPVYRLYYRNSTDLGMSWNSQVLLSGPSPMINKPQLDVVNSSIYIVWDDGQNDNDYYDVYYKSSADGGITWIDDLRLTNNLSRKALWPMIAVENGIEHIVWFDRITATNHDVMYKRYPDFPPLESILNITLQEGWNLISIPLEQSDESIDQVLNSIAGKWDCIQTYDSLSPEPWKTNNTLRPDQLNDFSTLNHKQGFWINITEPGGTILTVNGYDPPSTSIPLYAGWNLVGYPTLNNSTTVANALWGTSADKVEVFDPAEPYRIKEVGPTYLMKPGEGYWVHAPADTVWIIDW